MNDWRIHRREPSCARCQRAFAEGEGIFSMLYLQGEHLRREDHCEACFEEPGESKGELLFWRTRHALDRQKRFAVDFEAIEELFLALEGSPDPARAELRYLLSLLLLRKKRLKLVGVRRQPAGETLCLRRPRRQEGFEVQVFELDSARATALQAELARVFEGVGVADLCAPRVEPAEDAASAPVAEARARE